MAKALAPIKTFFLEANIIWTHYEYKKSGLLTISPISPLHKQHRMINDQIQHIHNNANPIQPIPN
jgi:hypothetical protein